MCGKFIDDEKTKILLQENYHSYPNHREHAIALINEGGCYPCLCAKLSASPYQPATVFSQMCLMGKCPIEDDNKGPVHRYAGRVWALKTVGYQQQRS